MVSKKGKVIVFAAIVIACFIAGCATQGQVKAATGTPRFTLLAAQDVISGNGMEVYHDDVNNVTCYVYHGAYGNAMTSIPDWQITAPKYNNTMVV